MEKKYFLRQQKFKAHEKSQRNLLCDDFSDAFSNTTNNVCSEHSDATCDSVPHRPVKNTRKGDIQVVIQDLSPCPSRTVFKRITGDHVADEKIHSDLYLLLLNDNKKHEIEMVLTRWWSLSAESSTEICVTLVNLLLEVSGYPKNAINTKTVTVETYMENLEACLEHYDQGPSMMSHGKFVKIGFYSKSSCSQPIFTLFHTLCKTCPKKLLLHDFGRELCFWILPLTKLYIRYVRQLSTLCLLHFNEELLHRFIKFQQEFEILKKENSYLIIPNYVEDYLSSNVALVPAQKHSRTKQADFENLQKLVILLYEEFMNERWKDCCAIIRNVTFSFLFQFSNMVPNIFLSNTTRISLIGYALSDREDSIRVMAAEYLADYVLHASADGHLWKHGFFVTFRERLLDLPYDKNYTVCSAGLVILTSMVNKGLLEDKDVEKVVHALWSLPSLLVMESQAFSLSLRRSTLLLYDSFAQFINECILSISVLDESSIEEPIEEPQDPQNNIQETTRHVLVLRCLLEFFVEFVDDYALSVDVLVTTFWNKTSSFYRVDILLEFFQSSDQNEYLAKLPPLSKHYRLPLCLLLLSITRHLELASNLAKTPRKLSFKKNLTKSNSEHNELLTATHTLLGKIIPLLKTTKNDALQARCLLIVLYEAALRVESNFFQDQYLENYEYLVNTFITTNDPNAPLHLQAALFYCLEQHVFKDEASHYHGVIMDHLLSSLQNTAAAIPFCEDKTNLDLSLLCVLLKLLGVSYAASDNPYENHFDLLDHLQSILNASLCHSYKVTPFLNILLSLQCLVVAYVHLWGDVDATLSFLKTSTCTQNSLTLTSPTAMSCKRRKKNRHITTLEEAMALLQKILTRIESLNDFIRLTFKKCICEAPPPRFNLILSYVYTMSMLDLTQFCFGSLEQSTLVPPKDNDVQIRLNTLMEKLGMTDEEMVFFSNYWTEKLSDLQSSLDENLFDFFKITRSIVPNFVKLYSTMSHETLVTIRQQELLPLHCQLILQDVTNKKNKDLSLKNDPLYILTLYWMICTFIQRISISPHLPFLLSSSLGCVIFQLFFYNNHVLRFSLEYFISNITKSENITSSTNTINKRQSLFFDWISHSVLSLLTLNDKSAKLKVILSNLAKLIPLEFFINTMDSFFLCIEEVLNGYNSYITTECTCKPTLLSCTSLCHCLIQLLPRFLDKKHVHLFSTAFKKHFKSSSKSFQTFTNFFIKRYPHLDLSFNNQCA